MKNVSRFLFAPTAHCYRPTWPRAGPAQPGAAWSWWSSPPSSDKSLERPDLLPTPRHSQYLTFNSFDDDDFVPGLETDGGRAGAGGDGEVPGDEDLVETDALLG